MTSLTLKISGMTCGHCAQAVTKALAAVPGVQSARVSLDAQEAHVDGDADLAHLIGAVTAQGYGAALAPG